MSENTTYIKQANEALLFNNNYFANTNKANNNNTRLENIQAQIKVLISELRKTELLYNQNIQELQHFKTQKTLKTTKKYKNTIESFESQNKAAKTENEDLRKKLKTINEQLAKLRTEKLKILHKYDKYDHTNTHYNTLLKCYDFLPQNNKDYLQNNVTQNNANTSKNTSLTRIGVLFKKLTAAQTKKNNNTRTTGKTKKTTNTTNTKQLLLNKRISNLQPKYSPMTKHDIFEIISPKFTNYPATILNALFNNKPFGTLIDNQLIYNSNELDYRTNLKNLSRYTQDSNYEKKFTVYRSGSTNACTNKNIILGENLLNFYNEYTNNQTRIFIGFISLRSDNSTTARKVLDSVTSLFTNIVGHENMFIIDLGRKTIIRFEPKGANSLKYCEIELTTYLLNSIIAVKDNDNNTFKTALINEIKICNFIDTSDSESISTLLKYKDEEYDMPQYLFKGDMFTLDNYCQTYALCAALMYCMNPDYNIENPIILLTTYGITQNKAIAFQQFFIDELLQVIKMVLDKKHKMVNNRHIVNNRKKHTYDNENLLLEYYKQNAIRFFSFISSRSSEIPIYNESTKKKPDDLSVLVKLGFTNTSEPKNNDIFLLEYKKFIIYKTKQYNKLSDCEDIETYLKHFLPDFHRTLFYDNEKLYFVHGDPINTDQTVINNQINLITIVNDHLRQIFHITDSEKNYDEILQNLNDLKQKNMEISCKAADSTYIDFNKINFLKDTNEYIDIEIVKYIMQILYRMQIYQQNIKNVLTYIIKYMFLLTVKHIDMFSLINCINHFYYYDKQKQKIILCFDICYKQIGITIITEKILGRGFLILDYNNTDDYAYIIFDMIMEKDEMIKYFEQVYQDETNKTNKTNKTNNTSRNSSQSKKNNLPNDWVVSMNM